MPGSGGRPHNALHPPDQLLALLLEQGLEPPRELSPVDRPLRQLHPHALRSEAIMPVPVPAPVGCCCILGFAAPPGGRLSLGLVGAAAAALVAMVVALPGVFAFTSIREDVREVLVHLRNAHPGATGWGC